jgi:hypothetical protein
MAGRWVDVGEAAQELGISTDAVRKRIARGSLRSDRENGSVRVRLDDGRSEAGREAHSEVLAESLRDQVGYLRSQLDIRTEELREHRRIIAALTQRIPELEAPASPEPPGGPERPAEGTVEPTSSEPVRETREGAERRPWWRRMFGS